MDRSGPEFATDADLAAGLFPPSWEGRFESDVGPGGRPYRRPPARRSSHVATAGCQNPERSPENSQHGLAGLSGVNAAAMVQSAWQGSQRIAAASTDRTGNSRRTPRQRNG